MSHHLVHRLQVGDDVQVLGYLARRFVEPEVCLILLLEVDITEIKNFFDCLRDGTPLLRGETLTVEAVSVLAFAATNLGHSLSDTTALAGE